MEQTFPQIPKLSIVSPVYQAQKILPELVSRLEAALKKITDDFEIILVEDHSPDESWAEIERLCEGRTYLKGFKLSRNFGQHYAITCGLDQAKGDWIVVMDCDLQDQPEEIEKLFKKAQEGYDVVLASRRQRNDSYFKKLLSKWFNRTLGYLTGSEQDETIANFGIYHRKVIDAVVGMRESIRFFPTMIKWVGFRQTKIEVAHSARQEGNSSYNLKRLFNLALDIILAFSDKPIRLVVKLGFLISFMAFVIATYFFIKWLTGGVVVLGYTSLIVSVWLLSGFIISTLGVIGLYVGKTFEGVKNRPIYIIEKTTA